MFALGLTISRSLISKTVSINKSSSTDKIFLMDSDKFPKKHRYERSSSILIFSKSPS